MRRFIQFISLLLVAIFMTACSKAASVDENEVRIGYFPNLTHIVPIVALEKGYFEEAYGADVKITTKTFTQGGLFMEAMIANDIDIGTTGPAPMINTFVKDQHCRIISGSVNGGAVFVTHPEESIHSMTDLKGKRVAIPGIGNTQDIMLRKALKEAGVSVTDDQKGVTLHTTAPADILTLFRQESIAAAAVPEPWGTILETEANGKIHHDWDEFAWGEDSPMTVVGVSDTYLQHEAGVKSYLEAHQKAIDFILAEPEKAQELVIAHLEVLTGQDISAEEVARSFERLRLTSEINDEIIKEIAKISEEANYIPSSDIDGLIHLEYIR